MGGISGHCLLSVIDLIFFCSDFGSIFAELLPGNFAKLQPPEGQDLTQGLEVRVQLGSVWKQSLTELSGGQRYVYSVLFDQPPSR
jgi:chromosome segregation ATPase